MHGLAGVRGQPAQSRGDVRRLRVVDEPNAVVLRDQLEPVRHPGKVRSASAIAASSIPAARAAAVAAAAFSRLCAPTISGSAGSGSSAANSTPRQPHPARDDLHLRCVEDPELRRAIRLERQMAVEVVGLEVQQDGDVDAEPARVLELEATRALRRSSRPRRSTAERRADVSRHRDVAAGGAEDRAEQLRGGRLAVRAGDADEARAGMEREAKVDLGDDVDAALACSREQRHVTGERRAT